MSIFFASIGLCRAQELSLRYTVKALPIPVLELPQINDKGQVAGGKGDDIFYYLPEPDYGLEPGLYPRTLGTNEDFIVLGMNNTGIIFTYGAFNKIGVYTKVDNFSPKMVNDDESQFFRLELNPQSVFDDL